MALINAANRTGTGGEDLLSNNFNWNLPVVSLPGRGLDLGLTLSYNSLVWVHSGNYIDYNFDDETLAPGFRLGFPTVEGPYWNDQANANFYLLVTPSGAHTELRQTGTATYESSDSSYLQLADNGSSLLLRSTEGTRMTFSPVNGVWRCNQIKDRNGNYITVNYNTSADIANIVDTLGRVVIFNYDGYANLLSITQAGHAQPWATFGYDQKYIGYNFPGLTSYGPDGTNVTVLTQVGLPDGSRYRFDYLANYGIVSAIHFESWDQQAQAWHWRSSTSYELPSNSGDNPRLTERHDEAENWTGINEVPSPVVTQFGHDTDGGCRMTAANNTVYKEYYGSTWQSGLSTKTKSYTTVADANNDSDPSPTWKKKTETTWTQDNTSVSYPTNPRVTQLDINDSNNNHRRTTIGYTSFSLPSDVYEYDANLSSILRRTHTDYNLTSTYTNLRIIGLPAAQYVCDGAQGATPCGDASGSSLLSKVGYQYDESSVSSPGAAVQHDDTIYGTGFVMGRGNLTSINRYKVDLSESTHSTATYNTAGSIISITDASTHTSTIGYADSFSDGNNHNTFAYPTTLTDGDGFQSLVQYDFAFGLRTRVQGPAPGLPARRYPNDRLR